MTRRTLPFLTQAGTPLAGQEQRAPVRVAGRPGSDGAIVPWQERQQQRCRARQCGRQDRNQPWARGSKPSVCPHIHTHDRSRFQ